MKKLIVAIVGVCAVVALAAKPQDDSEVDPDEFILPGKGSLAVISLAPAQNDVVQTAAKSFADTTLVKTDFKAQKDEFCCKKAADLLKASGASAAIFVIDMEGMPIDILAMEDRWAAVNVAALRKDGPDAEKLAKRLRCLVIRAAGQLLGVLVPRTTNGIMVGAASLTDLDVIKTEFLTYDLLANVKRYSDKSGLVPGRRMSYRKACEREIAPPPTTEYQKKVWDEFHSLPTKPIKIKFDKTLGK